MRRPTATQEKQEQHKNNGLGMFRGTSFGVPGGVFVPVAKLSHNIECRSHEHCAIALILDWLYRSLRLITVRKGGIS